MKDLRLNWAPPAQPLGDALREPVVIIDIKAIECDSFRFVCHDIPEPMAGKAKAEPAVAPAVDVQPAASAPWLAPIGTPIGVYDDEVTGDRYYIMRDGTQSVMRNARGRLMLGSFGGFARPPWLPAQREQVVEPMGRQP